MKRFWLYSVLLLTGALLSTNKSSALTQTYYISFGNMIYEYGDCGGAGPYACTPGYQVGFNWADVLPGGSTVTAVSIQVIVGVECSAAAHPWSLNYVGQGSYTPADNGCSCSTISNGVVTLNAAAGNYTVGGTNTFTMTTGASCLGFYNGVSGYYGIVTVTYGPSNPPCSWTGPSNRDWPSIPCNSFSTSLDVGSGTYTYFTAVAGATYTISTCGSPFDTDLTIYDSNPAWTARAWNQDNGPDCGGSNASLTWTATFSGNHIAIVNRVGCQQHDFTGQSAVLKFKQVCGCAPNQPASTWTGAAGSDWFNGSNWTNCVPGPNTNATIPVVGTMPVVNSAAAFVNTITVNPGASVTVNAPATLTSTQ